MNFKKIASLAVGVMTALLALQAIPVLAEDNTILSMEVKKYNQDERTFDISSMVKNGKAITNGKIRIYYESEKIKLLSSEKGELLSEAMGEINDCVTGNKSEGEIVLAFASPQEIPDAGSLMDMKFQLNEGVKDGDEISFQIKAEKLAGDNGDISAEIQEAIYVVGEGMKGGNEGGEKPEVDNKGDGTGKQDPSTKGSGMKQKGVKTGDDTPIGFYLLAVGGAAAAVVGCGIVLCKRKKK